MALPDPCPCRMNSLPGHTTVVPLGNTAERRLLKNSMLLSQRGDHEAFVVRGMKDNWLVVVGGDWPLHS